MRKHIEQPEGSGGRLFLRGFLLVFSAGVVWSFGTVPVKAMQEPEVYRLPYLFYRGLTVATILLAYLYFKEGREMLTNFSRLGKSGIIGACSLMIAFIGAVYSFTMTTIAVAMFMLALMPFLAAAVGFVVLREKVRPRTLLAMLIAFAGVMVMVAREEAEGDVWGALVALMSGLGFAVYSVTLRWRPETPKFTTSVAAGLLCALVAATITLSSGNGLIMPSFNILMSVVNGALVGCGLVLYSMGAKYLPAAELTMLSLMEVVGGIFWVWLPLFGINETPSASSLLGGMIIISAIGLHSLGIKKAHAPTTV